MIPGHADGLGQFDDAFVSKLDQSGRLVKIVQCEGLNYFVGGLAVFTDINYKT